MATLRDRTVTTTSSSLPQGTSSSTTSSASTTPPRGSTSFQTSFTNTTTGSSSSVLTPSSTNPTYTNSSAVIAPGPNSNSTDPTGISDASSVGKLSSGAVAGIAIGCAIIGALIAAGLVFFIMNRQPKKRSHGRHSSTRGSLDRPKTGHARYLDSALRGNSGNKDKYALVERSAEEVTAETVLEQPRDDSTIKQTVATLFKSIEDHAANYYTDKSMGDVRPLTEHKPSPDDMPSGLRLQPHAELETLLADRASRPSAIVALISAKLLDAIDFFGLPEKSLLPEMVTNFLRASNILSKDSQRSRLYLSRWRTGTAYLLGHEESPQQKEHIQRVTSTIVADLDTILVPYVNPETDNARRQHISKICKRTQDLGLLLLSQPADWNFYWGDAQNVVKPGLQSHRSERGRKPTLVVQPQLRRLTDNTARKLERPLVVLDWQVLN